MLVRGELDIELLEGKCIGLGELVREAVGIECTGELIEGTCVKGICGL